MFDKFIEMFELYNAHTNLMSRNDARNLKEKHIPDCLAIKAFFNKYPDIKTLVDIGTGGGLPAIPIAIANKNIDVYAVDSVGKKIKFIEGVKQTLSLKNLFPICARIEDFDKKNLFDCAIARAVAPLATVLEYCAPFVKQNGYVVAYKSKTADEELENAKNAVKLLNLQFSEKIVTSDNEDNYRCLLIFKKVKKTPLIYPRKNNLPRKKPL